MPGVAASGSASAAPAAAPTPRRDLGEEAAGQRVLDHVERAGCAGGGQLVLVQPQRRARRRRSDQAATPRLGCSTWSSTRGRWSASAKAPGKTRRGSAPVRRGDRDEPGVRSAGSRPRRRRPAPASGRRSTGRPAVRPGAEGASAARQHRQLPAPGEASCRRHLRGCSRRCRSPSLSEPVFHSRCPQESAHVGPAASAPRERRGRRPRAPPPDGLRDPARPRTRPGTAAGPVLRLDGRARRRAPTRRPRPRGRRGPRPARPHRRAPRRPRRRARSAAAARCQARRSASSAGQRVGQGAVRRAPLGAGGRPVDRRAHQRMVEVHVPPSTAAARTAPRRPAPRRRPRASGGRRADDGEPAGVVGAATSRTAAPGSASRR